MTSGFGMQPDQYFPPGVTNATPGFSAFSQKTQEDWQTEIDNSWMQTLGPLADLCALVDSLPIVKSLMTYGESFAAGNTANILHGIQLTTNDLAGLICTISGDVDINAIIDGANAMMAAANANEFYTAIVAIGQAISGVSGNVLIDLINGINHWLGDLIHLFLGDPLGLGTGIVSGHIPPLHIPGLDASKIVSGQFAQSFVVNLETDLTNIWNAIGSAETSLQQVWDVILHSIGASPGAGTPNQTQQYFDDLTSMLGSPPLSLGSFDPVTSVETFINTMIHPTNLLAPLVSGVVPPVNIPALTSSWGKTIEGQLLNGSVNASLIAGALTSATIGAAALTAGIIPAGIFIAGSALNSAIAAANVPALPAGWGKTIDGSLLAGQIATAVAPWAAPIDTLVGAWGGTGTGHTTGDLTSFAQSINTQYVQGVLGGADVGDTIENHVDTLVQAIQNLPATATGNSLAVLQGAMSSLRGFLGYSTSGTAPPTSVAGIAQSGSAYIANTAVTKPIGDNIDPTMISVFPLQDLKTATLTTVPCTQGATLIGFITATEAATKQSIQWLGYPTGGNFANFTDIRLNIYKMVSGVSTPVYQTPNIYAAMATGTSPVWNAFNLPSGNYLTVAQGDIYAVELQVVGAGTYNALGVTSTIPQHLTAVPAMSAATRNNITAYGPPIPAFETMGAGGGGNGGCSYTHTFNGNETFLLICTNLITGAGGGSWSITVDGRAVTNTIPGSGSVPTAGTGQYVWYLFPPAGAATFPAGTKTVAVSLSGYYLAVNSFGYSKCVGFNASPIVNGTTASTTLTQSISNKPNSLIVQFLLGMSTGNLTGYTQTQRYNLPYLGGNNYSMLVGDMPGVAGTVTGAATQTTSTTWGSIMVELVPPTPPASVPAPGGSSPFQYSTKTPFFGLSGVAGVVQYPSQIIPIYASQTLTNPTVTYPNLNHFDVVVCGDGGGGKGGHTGFAIGGHGGNASGWNYASGLTRAQMGSANLTWTIGPGGAGGAPSTGGGPGGNGSGSSCVIPGYGTISAAGGSGGTGDAGSQYGDPGVGAPTLTLNGVVYTGGAGGGAPSGQGGQPGGGGGGGNFAGSGSGNGGYGGAGIGYIYCYM